MEENIDYEEDSPVENKGKKVAKHDSGAADLEKVTDYVEEAEISSQDISNVRTILIFFQYRSRVYTWKFDNLQGSHSTSKTWKTWKNESTPGKPGNIMEF